MKNNAYAFEKPLNPAPTHMQPAGGGGDGPTEDDIIVVGHAFTRPNLFNWAVGGWMGQHFYAGFTHRPGYYFSDYDGVLVHPPAADEAKHEVKSTITRPLNAAETAVYEKFLGEVAAADKIISELPDNAIVRLPTGPDITGAQMKEIWAKTDFVINDIGHPYGNGTARGEAAYRNGDPQISFNIDLLGGYVNDPSASGRGGLLVIFHEIGHMTPHGRFLNDYYSTTRSEDDRQYSERYANDFAKTISDYFVGDSPSLSHLASEQPYSTNAGSFVFINNTYVPEPSDIPWWKFDSNEGAGFEMFF